MQSIWKFPLALSDKTVIPQRDAMPSGYRAEGGLMMDYADKYPYTRAERIGFAVLLAVVLIAGVGVLIEIVRLANGY